MANMSEKKLPHKPTNLRKYECDLTVNEQHLTKLEIRPYYEKHNQELLESLKRKGIKLSAKELSKKLITDDLIRKLVKELDGEKGIIPEGRYHHWTYYTHHVFLSDKAYKLV